MQFMVIRRGDAAAAEAARLAQAVPAGRWLHPSSESVRLARQGEAWTEQRGPFPADECVAGFTIVEAPSREAALAIAAGWPTADAEGGAVLEVRETGCTGGCNGVNTETPPHLTPFAVLLRSSPELEGEVKPPMDVIDRMNARNAQDAQAGVLLAGDGLRGTERGARVRFKGGKPTVVDGPFTEIKELIAGFWLIQAATREDAIAWVKSYPFPFQDAVLELREALR